MIDVHTNRTVHSDCSEDFIVIKVMDLIYLLLGFIVRHMDNQEVVT